MHIGTSITKLSRTLINLSVSLIGFSQTVPALIDSGTMLNFIYDRLVSTLRLHTLPCSPIKVSLADGHILTHATRYITVIGLYSSLGFDPSDQTLCLLAR